MSFDTITVMSSKSSDGKINSRFFFASPYSHLVLGDNSSTISKPLPAFALRKCFKKVWAFENKAYIS
jgi:hypothetical protein